MGNICTPIRNVAKPRHWAKHKYIPTKKVDVAIIGENNDGLKTINEYVVVKDLGKCSLGSLALIMNADQKQFALKTTQRKQAAASLAQLSSEVAALMRLHHPNVIKLHEVIDDARHAELFLVFEYAEGGPIMKLDEHGVAEGGPLELERAKRYTSQIVEGLVHLHRNNILHMNLQPSNILLDAHDTVKIVDFRVARVCATLCNTLLHLLVVCKVRPETNRRGLCCSGTQAFFERAPLHHPGPNPRLSLLPSNSGVRVIFASLLQFVGTVRLAHLLW